MIDRQTVLTRVFYTVKPLVPRSWQIALRRLMARAKRRTHAPVWPIDPDSAVPPREWPGWPDGKQFALVLSHDVDTRRGYGRVLRLADLEESLGLRSSFNFVPERYGAIELDLIQELKRRGFGVCVHGLKHDGKLFSSRAIFEARAPRINAYLQLWGTAGFTTPSMIRNHAWMLELNSTYCISSFDTDPFEPQSEGAGTIFPYWVGDRAGRGFLELPYTLVQDFTLFILLGETTPRIWRQKLNWIAEQGGMALLNTHPDYMNFDEGDPGPEHYPVGLYRDFLTEVLTSHSGRLWSAPPASVFNYLSMNWSNGNQQRQSGVA